MELPSDADSVDINFQGMTFRYTKVTWLFWLILFPLSTISACGPSDEYEVVELPPLPGHDASFVTAMNSADPVEIVGNSVKLVDDSENGFFGFVEFQAVKWTYDGSSMFVVQLMTPPDLHLYTSRS